MIRINDRETLVRFGVGSLLALTSAFFVALAVYFLLKSIGHQPARLF